VPESARPAASGGQIAFAIKPPGHGLKLAPTPAGFAMEVAMNRSHFAACLGALSLLIAPAAPAADWNLRVEGSQGGAYGNDRHALTIHDRDTAGAPVTDRSAGIDVDLTASTNVGFGVQRVDDGSGWGFDLFYFGITADGINRTASGSATNEIVFDASAESYSSTSAATVLYYQLREDNRLEMWTAELYYLRRLTPGVELQTGLQFADFDNDYRSTVGIQGVEGTFLDASSNYPRMMGPLVALNSSFREQRHRVEAYLGQGVVMGRASIKYSARHFTGTPSAPTVDDERSFSDFVQAVIPISQLRLRYSFQLTERLSLGTGVSTSVWWDVPVPPGVEPGSDADTQLHENTVVLYGVLANVEWRF